MTSVQAALGWLRRRMVVSRFLMLRCRAAASKHGRLRVQAVAGGRGTRSGVLRGSFGAPQHEDRGGFQTRRRWEVSGHFIIALLLTLSATPAFAVQPNEVLKDPVLESRARHISEGLRCLVCQNQSIDDSDAPLARDLRLIVRERLTAGDTNTQVVDYLVARYGEFVLLRPVFALHTLLLWLTPLLAVLLGGFGIWRLSRRRAPAKAVGLSQAEQAEVEALLDRR